MTNRRVAILLIALVAFLAVGVLVTATVAAQAVHVVRNVRTDAIHVSELLGDAEALPEGLSFSMDLGGKEMKWIGSEDGNGLFHDLPHDLPHGLPHADVTLEGFSFMGDIEMVEGPGVVLVGVAVDSPAAAAGVQRGDIVLSIDGTEINDTLAMHKAMDDVALGDSVSITVLHGDDERTMTIAASGDEDVPMLGLVASHGMPFGDITMGAFPFEPGGEIPMLGGMSGAGAMIAGVVEDGPAEEAGVEAGEIVTAIDGEEVTDASELQAVLEAHEPGDEVSLTLLAPFKGAEIKLERFRGADDQETGTITVGDVDAPESREIDVTLGEHPDNPELAFLGVELGSGVIQSITIMGSDADGSSGMFGLPNLPELPELGAFDLPDGLTRAVILGSVTDGGPAATAGLASGDFVMSIDGETLDDADALRDKIRNQSPGDLVTVTAYSPGDDEPRDVKVTLGEHPDEPGVAYLGTSNLGAIEIHGAGDDRNVNLWFDAGPAVGPTMRLHRGGRFHLPDIELPDDIQKLMDELHEGRDADSGSTEDAADDPIDDAIDDAIGNDQV